MQRMTERDRKRALEYLANEPAYNFFLDFDIRNYGFDADFQDVWCLNSGDDPGALLLRYYQGYLIYSADPVFDAAGVAQMLLDRGAYTVMGKASVIDRLAQYWPMENSDGSETHIAVRHDLLATLTETPPDPGYPGVFRADVGDVDSILALHFLISEFDAAQNPEAAREIIYKAVATGSGRYLCISDNGRMLTVAGSAAETEDSAAIVGVATAPDCRRRGYSTIAVGALCHQLMSEGRKFCVLFYDNPDAGKIYNRLGFKLFGMWAVLNAE